MKIHLQFSTTAGPVAALVRAVTWSQYSHVDFVLADGSLLGAQWHEKDGDGVQVRLPNYETFTKKAHYFVDVADEVGVKILTWARAQVGKKYDATAIFGILSHRDWKEDDSWFCSELVAAAFDQAGVPLIHEHLNRVTPQNLIQSALVQPE